MNKRKPPRPATQAEIRMTLKLLILQLRRHPVNLRFDAIDECKRSLALLRDEEESKATQRLTGIPVA